MKYENQDVVVLRDAKEGDKGYTVDGGRQVYVRFADKTERAVPASGHHGPTMYRTDKADVLRVAKAGDKDFDPTNKGEQLFIRDKDGHERAVMASEVTGYEKPPTVVAKVVAEVKKVVAPAPKTWNGIEVAVVRDAKLGDKDFDPKEMQKIVKLPDGTERVVLTKDVH